MTSANGTELGSGSRACTSWQGVRAGPTCRGLVGDTGLPNCCSISGAWSGGPLLPPPLIASTPRNRKPGWEHPDIGRPSGPTLDVGREGRLQPSQRPPRPGKLGTVGLAQATDAGHRQCVAGEARPQLCLLLTQPSGSSQGHFPEPVGGCVAQGAADRGPGARPTAHGFPTCGAGREAPPGQGARANSPARLGSPLQAWDPSCCQGTEELIHSPAHCCVQPPVPPESEGTRDPGACRARPAGFLCGDPGPRPASLPPGRPRGRALASPRERA